MEQRKRITERHFAAVDDKASENSIIFCKIISELRLLCPYIFRVSREFRYFIEIFFSFIKNPNDV